MLKITGKVLNYNVGKKYYLNIFKGNRNVCNFCLRNIYDLFKFKINPLLKFVRV